jgi:hypothetical protein
VNSTVSRGADGANLKVQLLNTVGHAGTRAGGSPRDGNGTASSGRAAGAEGARAGSLNSTGSSDSSYADDSDDSDDSDLQQRLRALAKCPAHCG